MELSRRRFLALGGAAMAGAALAASGAGRLGISPAQGAGGLRRALDSGSEPGIEPSSELPVVTAEQQEALAVLGRRRLRLPGRRWDPDRPPGTDLLPGLADNIVVLMMENHSYDNLFGTLGRGDGFHLDAAGLPTDANPNGHGELQLAFRMPTTCQLPGHPSQTWTASHEAFAGGAMDGFVTNGSGPVAMGYWTAVDLPFTASLARSFPIGDRWFSSVMGPTYPNRMFLVAGTSEGRTDDFGPGTLLGLASPPNGTVFTALSAAGISWTNYVSTYPVGATPLIYLGVDAALEDPAAFPNAHAAPFRRFFSDAAAGRLPAVSFLDPNYSRNSEESPQNIVEGEALVAAVVRALGASPQWCRPSSSALLVLVWDEHGGYYDHVPPPVALAPDDDRPVVPAGESAADGFVRYGFRVPSVVVSPYARAHGHVSSTVHDHTSILAMIEHKWNLAAMTLRDANANDLLDFVDTGAVAARVPTFPRLPRLAAPGDTTAALACSRTGPGTIPPPGRLRSAAATRR